MLFSKYLEKYNVIEENLTFYRQFEGNEFSKFKNLVNLGGKEEVLPMTILNFKLMNNLKIDKNLDFYISKIINKFL